VSAPGTVFNAPGEAAVSSLPHTDADFVARISVTGRLLDASSNVAQVLGWDLAPDNLYAGIPHEDDRLAGQRMIAHVASTEFASSEVIRPAAVLSDSHARLILAGLAADDVQAGGHWWTRVGVWRRYAGPWSPGADGPGSVIQLGTVSCVYDSPSRYSVTVFRVSLTIFGLHQEWTTQLLCDEAFAYAGLTLASCPRATLMPVPPPLRDY